MPSLLSKNQSIVRYASINSNNGRYTFTYQNDGNLVLYKNYKNGSNRPLWASNTKGKPGDRCTMQTDGNLVIIGWDSNPIWASSTNGNRDSYLVAQDDGNVVIYNSDNTPIWATNTVQLPVPDGPRANGAVMQPGEVLHPNEQVSSANDRFTFVFQNDGNLVLYKKNEDGSSNALWASDTIGQTSETCIMQADGNLVIYDGDANAIWSSNTWNSPGSRLIVQDDGNVVIYNGSNSPTWATNTVQ